MKIVFTVFVGWAILPMSLHFGGASSTRYNRQTETSLEEELKGEKRACPGVPDNARTKLVEQLLKDALGRSNVCNLFTYGCWCGPRGHGKYVDNFDYCCKVHDFCVDDLSNDKDKCDVGGVKKAEFFMKDFKYNKATNKCSPLSEYREGSDEEKRCRYALCLCDLDMVRCMGRNKNEIDTTKISYQKCTIKDSPVCNSKADVIVLIQDSQGTSSTTVENIKTVVRAMLRRLSSESTNFKFALAKYATTRQISCFGSADKTITYLNNEYQYGGSGLNRLNLALSKMVLKQFEKRRSDRKTDTAKILVIFSDGNTVDKNGDIMESFMLEKPAKLLRVNNNIKIAGVLIPNTENAPRIQELKGITSEPDDAINAAFSAKLDEIADLLIKKVKEALRSYGIYFCKDKADVIILIQDSQGISSATAENIKTMVKRMLTQLSSVSTDTKVAVATYATSRRISCFGRTKQAISYIDNEYQHGGKGHNLLNLALSKMVLKQFDKRPADRQTRDTARILVIFSDGNAQNENGDVMDSSILKQTAGSLQYNIDKIFGVLIPNTEKASRIQQLESIVSYPYEVLDATFNSIADLLAFRVKRMVGCLVKYKVKVYTRDSHARSDYRLTVRIEGQGEEKTANQALYETKQERENNLHVIVSEFYDLDVGTVKKINIKPRRLQSAPIQRSGWNLKEVKVTKGKETLTAVFDQAIPQWVGEDEEWLWYSARAWLRPYLTYSVKIYTPNTNLNDVYQVEVKISGEDYQETQITTVLDHATTPATETEDKQLVIKASFTDINVGRMGSVWIRPLPRADWTINKIVVANGEETVTANFNQVIPAWNLNSQTKIFSRNGA